MKQIINKIFQIRENENKKPEEQLTDRVLTENQLEGLRQAYIYQQEEEEENDVAKEMAMWTTTVKKGGD